MTNVVYPLEISVKVSSSVSCEELASHPSIIRGRGLRVDLSSLQNYAFNAITNLFIYCSRSAQFHGGVVNMLRPNVEVNTNIAESNEKPSSYSERVYNNIMHSEETFQRRQEAIRETKETRGSGSY